MSPQRFPVSFARRLGFLYAVIGMPPSRTYADIDTDRGVVRVRAGIWFAITIPVAHIRSAERSDKWVISRGVHGMFGRWLVNGSGRGLVKIAIDPRARGRIVVAPARVRELLISLEDPDGFLAALGR